MYSMGKNQVALMRDVAGQQYPIASSSLSPDAAGGQNHGG